MTNGENSTAISEGTARRALKGIVVIACVLMGGHWLSGRPLWNDELAVLNSLTHFQPADFFSRPLMSVQVFPRATLFLIYALARPLDFHPLALRFLSWVAMMGGFFLWLRIVKGLGFSDGFRMRFALTWTASVLLIYYSAELKPYAVDVAAGAVWMYCLCHWYGAFADRSVGPSPPPLAALVLPFWGLFSYTAFLFLPFLFVLPLRAGAFQSVPRWRWFLGLGGAAALALAVSYAFDMRWRPVEDVTQGFAGYFVSFSSVSEFLKTWQEGTVNLFTKWALVEPRWVKRVNTIFFSAGMVVLFKQGSRFIKRERMGFLNAAAFILYTELFFCGALKLYPFTVPRTSLFFAPFVLILSAQGWAGLCRWLDRRAKGAAVWVDRGWIVWWAFQGLLLSYWVSTGTLVFRPEWRDWPFVF